MEKIPEYHMFPVSLFLVYQLFSFVEFFSSQLKKNFKKLNSSRIWETQLHKENLKQTIVTHCFQFYPNSCLRLSRRSHWLPVHVASLTSGLLNTAYKLEHTVNNTIGLLTHLQSHASSNKDKEMITGRILYLRVPRMC